MFYVYSTFQETIFFKEQRFLSWDEVHLIFLVCIFFFFFTIYKQLALR